MKRNRSMICPRCSAKAHILMALAGERSLRAVVPNVFVQYRCEQGHYFITLKVFDGIMYQEHYLTPPEHNPDARASLS